MYVHVVLPKASHATCTCAINKVHGYMIHFGPGERIYEEGVYSRGHSNFLTSFVGESCTGAQDIVSV